MITDFGVHALNFSLLLTQGKLPYKIRGLHASDGLFISGLSKNIVGLKYYKLQGPISKKTSGSHTMQHNLRFSMLFKIPSSDQAFLFF